jgi:hypothetical protein
MSEFIYVLENSSMSGLVKIGRTERSVSERVSELSSPIAVEKLNLMQVNSATGKVFPSHALIAELKQFYHPLRSK